MLIKQYSYIQVFMIMLLLNMGYSERRTINRTQLWDEPRFMAYFVKSEQSVHYYQGWTCGGAIISPLHIITAAAYVINVDHLYAIVGYNKYISAEEIHLDPCTKNRKKRVIKSYAPRDYEVLNSGWTFHDIGVAKLDSPLDFTDTTYSVDCSYTPGVINVNFNEQFEAPDTDVIAVGWGDTANIITSMHPQDHSKEYLREIPLVIVERDVCKRKVQFLESTLTEQTILDSNIICVQCEFKKETRSKSGQHQNEKQVTTTEIVITSKASLKDLYDDDDVYEELFHTYSKRKMTNKNQRRYVIRRQGLCQNDHGGPLIAWINEDPIVIGIALTNLYNRNFSCIPPNLFTSTTPSEWFIKCSVKEDQETVRICQEMENRDGLNTNEVTINWIGEERNKIAEVAPLLSLQKLLSIYVEKRNTSAVFPNALNLPSIYQQKNGEPVPTLRNSSMSVNRNDAVFQSNNLRNAPFSTYQPDNMTTAVESSQPIQFKTRDYIPIISLQNTQQIKRETISNIHNRQNLERKPLIDQRNVPSNEDADNTENQSVNAYNPKNGFLQARARQMLPSIETYTSITKIKPLKDIKHILRSSWYLTRYNFEKRATFPIRRVTGEFINPDIVPNQHIINWKRRQNEEESLTTSVSSVSHQNAAVYTISSTILKPKVYGIKRIQWYYEKLNEKSTR